MEQTKDTIYEIVINGYLQQSIYPFHSLKKAINFVNELRQDGRIKTSDKVQIKTTNIVYSEV